MPNALFTNNKPTKQRHNDTNSAKNWTLDIGHWSLKKGFTLVELIVSVTITSILMLGLSVFFSSTFSNLFRIQTQSANTERQFAVNEIIRDKFNTLEYLVEEDPKWILSFNQTTKGQLPFSYIGSVDIGGKDHLVFKDVMIFNKIFDTGARHEYNSGGEGKIRNASSGGGMVTTFSNLKNFAGFAIKDGNYFVADPASDTIQTCPTGNLSTCLVTLDFSDVGNLSHPTDVATDGTKLYISDSGNNRIIRYVTSGAAKGPQVIASDDTGADLNFPTGLTYYQGPSGNYLFVADTFNHKIKRIDLATFDIKTIAGSGTNEACSDTTAKFCKLNLPTGLFALKDNGPPEKHELYIADSSNNRILKISDPGSANLSDFEIKFDLESNTRISRIDFVFPNGSTLTNISEVAGKPNTLHKGKYDIDETTLKYQLTTSLLNSFMDTPCHCSEDPEEVCSMCLASFDVNHNDNIFVLNDKILFGADTREYQVTNVVKNATTEISVSATDEEETTDIAFASGTIVKLNKTFFEEEYQFNFDLSDPANTFPTGFQNITIKIYDENQQLVQESNIIMRMGDGELGTSEDVIEVLASEADGVKFPTGVSDQHFVNSGLSEVWGLSTPPAVIPTANLDIIYTTAFSADVTHSDFDYISDFTINSINFSKHNPANRILELVIEANIDDVGNTQTYKLNAILPAP